jgi:hypothetical protein
MPHLRLAAILFTVWSLAAAQASNFTELKSQNPAQLSADDLQPLIPGAKVFSHTNSGTTRNWHNKSDGTLVASSDNRATSGGRTYSTSGEGTWRLDRQGRWCVNIQWLRAKENWCRYLFKAGEKCYGYGRLDDNAVGSEFEISH